MTDDRAVKVRAREKVANLTTGTGLDAATSLTT